MGPWHSSIRWYRSGLYFLRPCLCGTWSFPAGRLSWTIWRVERCIHRETSVGASVASEHAECKHRGSPLLQNNLTESLTSQIFTSASDTLLETLCVPRHTFASRYIQLFTAFVLSALLHELAALLSCRADCGELRFFVSQAIAIFVEDQVVDLGEHLLARAHFAADEKSDSPVTGGLSLDTKAERQWYWRVLGFFWVFTWFSYSLRLYIDKQVRHGFYVPETGFEPISTRWIK